MSAVAAPGLAAGLVVLVALSTGAARRAGRSDALRRRLGAPATATGATRPGPARLEAWLEAGGLTWPAGITWAVWRAGAAVLVAVGAVVGGPILAIVAAVAAVGGPLVALAAVRGRGHRLAEAAIPEVLEAVARSLRTGGSLRQALVEAERTAPPVLAADLAAVRRAVANGAPLGEALEEWPRRRPLPAVRLAVAALGLGVETGGAQARAIDGVAATVRGRLAVQAEVHALASQARASALVIGLAPVGFAVLAAVTDERTADFLLRSGPGAACLLLGLGLDGVAVLWMRRVTRVEA